MDNKDKNLLDKIESGKLKMRPKYYFIIRDLLVVLAALAIFLVSVFLVGLVFFALRQSGASILPRFGSAGFRTFIVIFPWLPVVIALVLTFLLSLVLKQYSFAYRKPLLYVPLLIITILIAAGYLTDAARFHNDISDFSARNHTPIFEPLYRNYKSIGRDQLTVGEIITSSPDNLQIESDEQQVMVNITSNTQFPYGNDFAPDEPVVIIGNRANNSIDAIAIRKLPSNQLPQDDERGFFLFRLGWPVTQ